MGVIHGVRLGPRFIIDVVRNVKPMRRREEPRRTFRETGRKVGKRMKKRRVN